MTTTDVIYLVKELAICQYVIIIHSPHLCGLPGFRAPHADVQPAGIRCRQVVSDEDFKIWTERDKARNVDTDTLRLPWARPTGGAQGATFSWDQPKQPEPPQEIEVESVESAEDPFELKEYEIDDDILREILNQAFDAHQLGGEDGEDEFMLVSLEEDDDGNIVLGGDVMGSDKKKLEGEDKELLLQAVRKFLESKGDFLVGENEDDEVKEGQAEGDAQQD
jgi:protein OS-9